MPSLEDQARRLIDSRFNGNSELLPNMMKALIHDAVIPALAISGLLGKVVFRGDTALQRFYSNHRFSEDLDFVCGQGKTLTLEPESFESLGERFEEVINKILLNKYDINAGSIMFKKSKDPYSIKGQDVKVQVWQLSVPVDLYGEKQVVKVEVANVPSHQPVNKFWHTMIASNSIGPGVPSFLRVESITEIMADKIVALACRRYLKYRDVWDYHILLSQRVKIDDSLVEQKFADYGIDQAVLLDHLYEKIFTLRQTVSASQSFWKEMSRFVWPESLHQYKDTGLDATMIKTALKLLTDVSEKIEDN
jgi:hypothetical protein